MKINKSFFLCLSLIAFLSGNLIVHDEIEFAPYGFSIPITALLNISESDINRFSLLYRPKGNTQYIEVEMIKTGRNIYNAEIPSEFCKINFIEYYLLLEMKNHAWLKYPTRNAQKKPIRVQINVPKDGILSEKELLSDLKQNYKSSIINLEPEYIILSPKPNERLRRQNLFIALSFFRMKNIDPKQVKVYLDGIDMTNQANIDSTYLTLQDNTILPGNHTARVEITNIIGQKYKDIVWSFTILPGETKSFGLLKKQSSNIRINYHSGGIAVSEYSLGEIEYNHYGELDWLTFQFNLFRTNLDNQYSQPYNRYSILLTNELLNIKFGDSYPNFDNFAWNGKRIRGVNFSFFQKPISFDIIKGKTAEAIQGNPMQNAMLISYVDSTLNNWKYTISRDNYTFQQDVFAIKFQAGYKSFKWDISSIKVQDNISTVSKEISNAQINLPSNLMSSINPNSNQNIILFDSLKNNIPLNTEFNFLTKDWIGQKPKDNFILSSNIQFGLDNTKIIIMNGISISFLNRNKWNKIESIYELDTLAYDPNSQLDGFFLETVPLDTSFSISKYEKNISFGQYGQPIIPYLMSQNSSSLFNLSNAARHSIIYLNYLGQRIELGAKRNGPDYYSILNPTIRTNYKETYFSDQFNLFNNKLLFYYKKSKITEGLYKEISIPIETINSEFRIGLFPGNNLPNINFGFIQSNSNNGIKSYKNISDTLLFTDASIDTIITKVIDNRIDFSNRQFNISMTNYFNLWTKQVLSLNILIRDRVNNVVDNSNLDSLSLLNYFQKDVSSESYGINLKTIYNNHWESNLYFNKSHYDIINLLFTDKDENTEQKLNSYRFQLYYQPNKYISNLTCGIYYSIGYGNDYFSQYNFNMGITSENIANFFLKLMFDYRVKFLGKEEKSPNDIFFKAQISYEIL